MNNGLFGHLTHVEEVIKYSKEIFLQFENIKKLRIAVLWTQHSMKEYDQLLAYSDRTP